MSGWKCKICGEEAITLGGPNLMCVKKDCSEAVEISRADKMLENYTAQINAGHEHGSASADMTYVPITWNN